MKSSHTVHVSKHNLLLHGCEAGILTPVLINVKMQAQLSSLQPRNGLCYQWEERGPGFTYSSFRAHRRLVSVPYFLSVSVSSEQSLSARDRGMPSHTRMRITITAASQVWPARSRTKHSSFSSLLLLRTTCAGHHSTPTPPTPTKTRQGSLAADVSNDLCMHIFSCLGHRATFTTTCNLPFVAHVQSGSFPWGQNWER